MADISKTALNVRGLPETQTLSLQCGEAIDVGEAVYLKSDGKVWLADADAADTAQAIGICIAVGAYGALSSVANDQVDVAVYGPVAGFSGMTPGAEVFSSTTAGAIADTAPAGSSGDYRWTIGFALKADVIFVKPYTTDVAAQ